MDIFNVLNLLGGLALFLFGMKLLGDNLEKLSGGKLESVLEKVTSKPVMAVILGAGVTAAIMSSSVTTVMVVGFVNSGIMKLGQAVYIIMGANVGSTIASWITSLSSLSGGGTMLLKFLKPDVFSSVLAFIGIIFVMFCKSEKKHIVGRLLLGFAILMTGMENMSSSVSGLKDVPGFSDLFLMFSNPVLGMLVGAVLTAAIQSSAASVGILQALCATGGVMFSSVVPIIMGQNIGTCITAMLSAIGAKKNAKRTAVVHLYFNLIGTILFMCIFYALNALIDFAFMDKPATSTGIAIIHTTFNITATVLLFPAARLLEKLACLTVRDKEDEKEEKQKKEFEKEFELLDDRFLEVPGLATEHCRTLTIKMSELAKEAVGLSVEQLFEYDEKRDKKIVELENLVDYYEDELGAYMVKVSGKSLSKADSRTISILLHSIGDFERISDHAVNISEAAQEKHEKNLEFSEAAVVELKTYAKALHDIVTISFEAFAKEDMRLAAKVEPLEEVIDSLNFELKKRHVNRLRNGICTIEMGFIFSDVTTSFERIADHCSNVGISIVQRKNDAALESHIYIDQIKAADEVFREKFEKYKDRYALPEFEEEKL